MPGNFVADIILTKKPCSKPSSSEVHFLSENGHRPFRVFEHSPWGGGLQATYAVHFRLVGKRVVDFLSVIIELFSQGFTAELLRANID